MQYSSASPSTIALFVACDRLRRVIAVDQGQFGLRHQLRDGARHAEHRRVEDVEPVDVLDVDDDDAEGDRTFADACGERLAAVGGKDFRIGQIR